MYHMLLWKNKKLNHVKYSLQVEKINIYKKENIYISCTFYLNPSALLAHEGDRFGKWICFRPSDYRNGRIRVYIPFIQPQSILLSET
jgi:hypothetical protein